MTQHKNDMYGDDTRPYAEGDPGIEPPIPAATVVLLRDGPTGLETLMLKKNSKIAFGGMWVFPGGRIDPSDQDHNGDEIITACNAAVREAQEEAGLRLAPADLVWFARWTPPPAPRRRFTTWFFAAHGGELANIQVDQGEITDHVWINPAQALERHAAGELEFVPPTWVTLHQLCSEARAQPMLERLAQQVRVYCTRVDKLANGDRVAMWEGDAGYEDWAANTPGARHRLVMAQSGFRFENDVVTY